MASSLGPPSSLFRPSTDTTFTTSSKSPLAPGPSPAPPVSLAPPPDALLPSNLPETPIPPRAHIALEAIGEFLGTLILVGFGTGANCQYVVADNGVFNTYATVPIGWAMGIALGNAFAARWSGGHINPAVTLMLALVGQVPWWKVPVYYVAQVAGGFAGAAITYGVYFYDISVFDPQHTIAKTAGLFGTFPGMSEPAVSCWLAEFFPATVLLGAVLYVVTLTPRPTFPVLPLILFITLLGIGCSFGTTTSFSINPARDLGPRLLTYAVGYGRAVWDYKRQYWLWGGQLGAFSAAVFVGGMYRVVMWAEERYVYYAHPRKVEAV